MIVSASVYLSILFYSKVEMGMYSTNLAVSISFLLIYTSKVLASASGTSKDTYISGCPTTG